MFGPLDVEFNLSKLSWGRHLAGEGSLLLPVGQTSQRFQSLAVPDARLCYRLAQPVDRLVVDYAVHRVGMPILTTVREAEARRIAHTCRRSVYDVCDQRQSAHRFGAHTGNG